VQTMWDLLIKASQWHSAHPYVLKEKHDTHKKGFQDETNERHAEHEIEAATLVKGVSRGTNYTQAAVKPGSSMCQEYCSMSSHLGSSIGPPRCTRNRQ